MKLIGAESVVTPTSRSVITGKILVCKYVASVTGLLKEVSVKTQAGQLSNEAYLGIYEDGGTTPAALLGQSSKVTVPAGENVVAATGLSVKVVEGVSYWLAVVSTAGNLLLIAEAESAATENERRSVKNEYTGGLQEGIEWGALQKQAPYIMFGSGISVPVSTSPPAVSGTAQQGQALTEVHGAWTNEPTSYTLQWLRCNAVTGLCKPIPGATASTYTPGQSDVGRTLRVREAATNSVATGAPAESAATATVEGSLWREPIGDSLQKKRAEEEQRLNVGCSELSVQQVLAPHGPEEPNPEGLGTENIG